MLDTYKDVYTLDKFLSRAENIQIALRESEKNQNLLVLRMKERVETQIEKLKEKEKKIYHAMGLKDGKANIKGLNERLKEYSEDVIYLSGPLLREEIVGVLNSDLGEQFETFKKTVNDIAQEEIVPLIGKEGTETFGKAYLKFLQEAGGETILHGEFEKRRNKFRITEALDINTNKIITSALTRNQRKRWEEIIGKRAGASSQKNKITIDDNKVSFNWLEETGFKTPTEAGKELTLVERKKISRKISAGIVNLVPPKNEKALREILNYILRTSNYTAYFVGQSTAEIIGLCGEIQAIYYLYCFLGKDPKFLGTKIKWIGSDKIDGQKPHRDVLLEDLFGIQVKNSLTNEFKTINFSDASLNTVLDRIGAGDEEIRNLVSNYYGTLAFNIGYNYDIEKKKYYKDQENPLGSNNSRISKKVEQYKTSYKKLQESSQVVDKLLSLSAAALMYMDIGEEGEKLDANVLYLLSGATFFAASDILQKVLDEVSSKEKLPKAFTVKVERSEDERNIVTALNNEKRGSDYSTEVLKKIMLTSSFNFSSIKPK